MAQLLKFRTLALAAVLLSIVYLPIAPTLPQDTLDSSWQLGIAYGLERGLRFGHDLTFTYGPLGGLFFKVVWDGRVLYSVLLWLGLILGCAGAMHLTLKDFPVRSVAFAVLPLLLICSLDAFVIYLLFCVVCASPRIARDWRLGSAYSLLFAVLALCKFTFAAASTIALLPVACFAFCHFDRRDWRRYIGWLLFPIAWPLFWILLGQELGDFPSYVTRSYTIARSYSVAMAIEGPDQEVGLAVGIFAGLLISVSTLLSKLDKWSWRLAQLAAVAQVLALCALCWLALKQGFVRHDGHALAFMAFSGSALATLWFIVPRQVATWKRLSLPAAGALWCALTMQGAQAYLGGPVLQSSYGLFASRLTEASRFLRGADDWAARFRAALEEIRTAHPMQAEGSVDIASVDLNRVLANGLDWHPRPVFQSYSVYSPALARANAGYVADDTNGPRHYFINLVPVDGRMALQEDAGIWFPLLTRFDAVDIGSEVHLRRRSHPRTVSRREVKLQRKDQFWSLPEQGESDFVELSMVASSSLAQRFAAILLRPQPVYLEMHLGAFQNTRFRFVTSLEATPFIVSPLVRTNLDFMLLSTRHKFMRHQRVEGVRFVDGSGHEIPVRKRPRATLVTLGGQSEFEHAGKLRVSLLTEVVQAPDAVVMNPVLLDEGRYVINAHSPSTLSFFAAERSYKICFGIRSGVAWASPEFDGVRYLVKAEQGATPLVDRVLTPRGDAPTPREECRLVEIPTEGGGRLTLETEPNGTTGYDWAYWLIEPS